MITLNPPDERDVWGVASDAGCGMSDARTACDTEAERSIHCGLTADSQEAANALLENRTSIFISR